MFCDPGVKGLLLSILRGYSTFVEGLEGSKEEGVSEYFLWYVGVVYVPPAEPQSGSYTPSPNLHVLSLEWIQHLAWSPCKYQTSPSGRIPRGTKFDGWVDQVLFRRGT